jgi:hypothetical protein
MKYVSGEVVYHINLKTPVTIEITDPNSILCYYVNPRNGKANFWCSEKALNNIIDELGDETNDALYQWLKGETGCA